MLPRYPIYIPSKGRFESCLTAKLLIKDKVPFQLVVEPQEYDEYAKRYGSEHVLTLPFSNRGSVIPARNWIKQHATEQGHLRHWQLDDNIRVFYRFLKGKRIPCDSGVALLAAEDFTDRYENIAITGLNYKMFIFVGTNGKKGAPPFHLNCRVYSCSLILNSIPYEWRGRYNEDTDICLQALSGGWCTVLINAFLIDKIRTMVMKGGNNTELYQKQDGRLKMARSLERVWNGVVETKRRFHRPQHVVKDAWRRFDTPLKLKEGIRLEDFKEPNEYGMKLTQVADEIKSSELRQLLTEYNEKHSQDSDL